MSKNTWYSTFWSHPNNVNLKRDEKKLWNIYWHWPRYYLRLLTWLCLADLHENTLLLWGKSVIGARLKARLTLYFATIRFLVLQTDLALDISTFYRKWKEKNTTTLVVLNLRDSNWIIMIIWTFVAICHLFLVSHSSPKTNFKSGFFFVLV